MRRRNARYDVRLLQRGTVRPAQGNALVQLGPLGRQVDMIAPFPRAAPWAGRTAGPLARLTTNRPNCLPKLRRNIVGMPRDDIPQSLIDTPALNDRESSGHYGGRATHSGTAIN